MRCSGKALVAIDEFRGGVMLKTTLFVAKSILLSFLFLSYGIYKIAAQQNRVPQEATEEKYEIRGRVVASGTSIPLQGANIFLEGTMYGTASSSTGEFGIVHAPAGTHELIISMMGYHFKKIKITLPADSSKFYMVKLKERILQAPEIVITASMMKERKKRMEMFYSFFIGESKNAAQCTIKNPGVITFESELSSGEIINASSVEDIIIENRALGYELRFQLEKFLLTRTLIHAIGSKKFTELEPADKKEKERWRKNRLRAYNGSPRHFFRSLYTGRLKKNGYRAKFYRSRNGQLEIDAPIPLKKNIVFNPGRTNTERSLNFDGRITIMFWKERAEESYFQRQPISQDVENKNWTQDSWIELKSRPTYIDTLGRPNRFTPVLKGGYMGWEQLAEALPWEYIPQQ